MVWYSSRRSSVPPASLSLSLVAGAAMWDQLLSNPATRAYLMRYPPSTWEEKTVEAVQNAVKTEKVHQRSSQSTKQSHSSGRPAHSQRAASTPKNSHRKRSSRATDSVPSSPSLPAQPISVVTAPQPPHRSPLVRPLPLHHPLLTGHERPLTYAEEYYYGNPYSTSAAAIGAHVNDGDWPHRIGRNERNYSSATLLHHHDYPPTAAAVPALPSAGMGRREEAAAADMGDEAVQASLLPSSAVEEEAAVAETSDDKEAAAIGGHRRYVQQRGSDITINVQCQHPQHHSQQHSLPPHYQLPPSTVAAGRPFAEQPLTRTTQAGTAQSAPIPLGATASPSVHLGSAAAAAAPPPPSSTPFYSSAQPSRPPLHPSYSHPHSVYPAWWPSEEDRLAEERREEARRAEHERRQRRQAERQRENNGRVRGVMQHTCPPPVPQAREGVAERKEDRQRQLKRAEMERTSDGLLLHSAGDELNILAAVPSSSSHSAVAASIASTDLRNSRREPVAAQRPSHPSIRPAAQAQSRIKPLLDRDRRQSTLYDKWGATVSMQPTVSSEEGSRDMRFVPPASSPLSSSSYASLIRSLAADPIVSSFASQPGQQQPPQQQPEPLSALSRPSSDSSSLSMSSALSRRAELLAAAASVSTAAAAAALDGLDNVNRDTDEDRLAARRKWDSIAAEQAAKPFNRQLQRHGQSTGWREVQVEDGSDDSDEAERMLGERTSSSRASRS